MTKTRILTGIFIFVGGLLKLFDSFVEMSWVSISGNIILGLGLVGYLFFVISYNKEK